MWILECFNYYVIVCTSVSSPTQDNVDSGVNSVGSDTASGPEFKQVKLHAQNQIILSQVLSEEREQVNELLPCLVE